MLCISGPPGMGKSYMTHRILEDRGVNVYDIPASMLESNEAGVPANVLQDVYYAQSMRCRKGEPSAILIDDIDAAVGDWGPMTQYVMNRQLVFSTLMRIADNPGRADKKASGSPVRIPVETARCPIIMICNDSGKLYPPLLRPGRTRCFDWSPDSAQKTEVVRSMFPELGHEDLSRFVAELDGHAHGLGRYPHGAPISLFSDIRYCMNDDAVYSLARGLDARGVMSLAVSGVPIPEISVEDLIDMGKSMLVDDSNYLEA